jgi:hypothetical protein
MISAHQSQKSPAAAQCISCLDSKLKKLINQCARLTIKKNNNKRKPLINLGRCMQIEAEISRGPIQFEQSSRCWLLMQMRITTDIAAAASASAGGLSTPTATARRICYLLNGAPCLIN